MAGPDESPLTDAIEGGCRTIRSRSSNQSVTSRLETAGIGKRWGKTWLIASVRNEIMCTERAEQIHGDQPDVVRSWGCVKCARRLKLSLYVVYIDQAPLYIKRPIPSMWRGDNFFSNGDADRRLLTGAHGKNWKWLLPSRGSCRCGHMACFWF